MTSLLEYYFEKQREYENKYGKNTVVFLMKGTFYEVYSTNTIGKAPEISKLLNIALTKANKNIPEVSATNPYMMGVPVCSSKKYLKVLVENMYTVVTIDQRENHANTDRYISKIYSAGTIIEDLKNTENELNYICCIFVEYCESYIFGITFIELSTGNVDVHEIKNGIGSLKTEELFRIVESYKPQEVIVSYDDVERKYIDNVCNIVESSNRIIHLNKITNDFIDINYQNNMLSKVYSIQSLQTPIENLDLEMLHFGRISFVYLLQFIYEHDESVLKKLKQPTIKFDDDILLLNNNSMYQLGLLNNNGNKSLFDIINKTSTVLGKRKLFKDITVPSTNLDYLNDQYNQIEHMMGKIEYVESKLKQIVDVERLIRKIELETLQPFELCNLFYSYENAHSLMEQPLRKELGDFIDDVINQLDLGKCNITLNDITCSIFKEDYETEDIKTCMKTIVQIDKKLDIIRNMFIRTLGKKDVKIYIEGNHKSGYSMQTTVSRGEVLKKFLKDKGYHFKNDKSKCCITSEQINELFHNKIKEEEKLKPLVIDQYKKTINDYYLNYHEMFKKVNSFIANIDAIKSKAKVAIQYKYTKPIIENSKESYFSALGLRHPIVEQLNTNNGSYVPNDVQLDDSNNGILLYGVNGAGKSCYSKAIGLCIILAQSGHYVPADELKLGLFNKLYTRISDHDNIYKGQSSFFVEMSELKSIIHYADANSIVLGDEVCKGTEDVSAVAIVSSSLKWLLDRQSKFVFATHLHNLTDVSIIKGHPKLSIKHLAVECNRKSDLIEFTRELKDGKGDSLYGVEIAKAVLDNDAFIKQTCACRNEVLKKHNKLLSNKKSRYNSTILVDKCEIPGCESIEQLDSHHIIFQSSQEAEKMNVHNAGNLVILCKKHHQDVHNGNLVINKWKNTTKGKVLDYYLKD